MITLNLSFDSVEQMHSALAAIARGHQATAPAPVATFPVLVEPSPVKVEAPKPVKAPKAEKPAPTPSASETATTETTPEASAPSEPAAVSPSEPKALTLEEVRAKLSALSAIGKAASAKQIIADTGHSKLTEVPVSFYAEMVAKAEKVAA